jgi:hypothetical protein
MTLRERHSIGPAAFHPSRLRATTCNADVRFNSDGGTHNAHSTVPDPPRFTSGNRGRRARAHCALSSRNPACHLALIEIP